MAIEQLFMLYLMVRIQGNLIFQTSISQDSLLNAFLRCRFVIFAQLHSLHLSIMLFHPQKIHVLPVKNNTP